MLFFMPTTLQQVDVEVFAVCYQKSSDIQRYSRQALCIFTEPLNTYEARRYHGSGVSVIENRISVSRSAQASIAGMFTLRTRSGSAPRAPRTPNRERNDDRRRRPRERSALGAGRLRFPADPGTGSVRGASLSESNNR
ncbi:hypothetical protein EVAR_9000_1 [Eumeta japonica]|uniref:Uncharacterized protein n=1 Tax=Eumeta variegata TaxID=151549 RepID=A0A4C1WQF5_EUMVA|nr:hypothetical protein EVAR_9000_1 [Eumeta japonica]